MGVPVGLGPRRRCRRRRPPPFVRVPTKSSRIHGPTGPALGGRLGGPRRLAPRRAPTGGADALGAASACLGLRAAAPGLVPPSPGRILEGSLVVGGAGR